MKRLLGVTILASFSILALHAQEYKPVTGYVGFGFTTPTDQFGERHETGWNFLGGIGYQFSRMTAFNFEYTYNQLGYAFTPQTPIGGVLQDRYNGDTMLHGFTLGPRFTIPLPRSDVYFTGNYGIYNARFELTRPGVATTVICDPYWYWCGTGLVPVDFVVGERSTWKQGWNAGMGFEFGTNVKFFADARFNWVATPNIRYQSIPVAFGVRF